MPQEKRRRCPKCQQNKALEEFGWRDKAHQKVQSYCRDCTRQAWVRWYSDERNRQHHLGLVATRRRRRLQRHQALVRELKSVPCADCGQTFPFYVMDFDHSGSDVEKEGEVSSFVYHSGTSRLMAEVAKCQVVCANCHRIRTYKRLNGESI